MSCPGQPPPPQQRQRQRQPNHPPTPKRPSQKNVWVVARPKSSSMTTATASRCKSAQLMKAWAVSGGGGSGTKSASTTSSETKKMPPPPPSPNTNAPDPPLFHNSNHNNNNNNNNNNNTNGVFRLDLTDSSSCGSDEAEEEDILEVWIPKKRRHSNSSLQQQQQQQQQPPLNRHKNNNDNGNHGSNTNTNATVTFATAHTTTATATGASTDNDTRKLPIVLHPPYPNADNNNNTIAVVRVDQDNDDAEDDPVEQVRQYQELHTQRHLRYTLSQFVKELWRSCEIDLGIPSTQHLEDCKSGIRHANHHVQASESTFQATAQYGRLLFSATQTLLHDILQVDAATDVVVDIGSGIGNVVLQAAYVHQCAARGLEVVELRHVTAVAWADKLAILNQQHQERDGQDYTVGTVDLRHGSLHDPTFRSFLTNPNYCSENDDDNDAHSRHQRKKTRIKAFCNNYNDVFGEKSVSLAHAKKGWTLDRYTAGLLAGMPPGSIMLTLHPLPLPLPPQSQLQKASAQQQQQPQPRARGMRACPGGVGGVGDPNNDNNNHVPNASFYDMEKILLGPAKDWVSWASGDGELWGYKYTRLSQRPPSVVAAAVANEQQQQQQEPEQAVFWCSNPDCRLAQDAIPIPATERRIEQGHDVVVVRDSGCPNCGTTAPDRALRTRR